MWNRLAVIVTMACVVTGFGLVGAFGDEQDEAFKMELKGMAGTWKPTSIENDGIKVPEVRLKDVSMTRDEAGKVIMRRGETVVVEGTVKKIDASKKPKTMDTEETLGEQKGNTLQGIYELDGDTLKICVVLPGKGERPTEFSGKAGSGCRYIVYKREKK